MFLLSIESDSESRAFMTVLTTRKESEEMSNLALYILSIVSNIVIISRLLSCG